MKAPSENRFTVGKVGETVKIRIPDVNKARSDLRNILGVILSGKYFMFRYISFSM